MTDPLLDDLRAAYPALVWARRRGKGCTRYHGRSARFAFPLVVVKATDGSGRYECTLRIPYIGTRTDWAMMPDVAVYITLRQWRLDVEKAEAALSAVFGGAA